MQTGDIEKARSCYNVYVSMTGHSDKEFVSRLNLLNETTSVKIKSPITSSALFEKFDGLLNNPSFDGSDMLFKGYINPENMADGYAIIYWRESGYYQIGKFHNGKAVGKILEAVPKDYHFSTMENCNFFVYNIAMDGKSEASCYNITGDLIYNGPINNRRPENTYSMEHSSTSKRFEALDFGSGCYIGETLEGQFDGFGLFIFSTGDCWVGIWNKGERGNGGFIFK